MFFINLNFYYSLPVPLVSQRSGLSVHVGGTPLCIPPYSSLFNPCLVQSYSGIQSHSANFEGPQHMVISNQFKVRKI